MPCEWDLLTDLQTPSDVAELISRTLAYTGDLDMLEAPGYPAQAIQILLHFRKLEAGEFLPQVLSLHPCLYDSVAACCEYTMIQTFVLI